MAKGENEEDDGQNRLEQLRDNMLQRDEDDGFAWSDDIDDGKQAPEDKHCPGKIHGMQAERFWRK